MPHDSVGWFFQPLSPSNESGSNAQHPAINPRLADGSRGVRIRL